MKRRGIVVALALVAAFVLPAQAGAHDQSFSYADIDWQGARLALTVTLHHDDAATLLGVEPASLLLADAAAGPTAGRLAREVAARFRIRGQAEALVCRFLAASAVPERNSVALRFNAFPRHPLQSIAVESRLFPVAAQHETFLKVYVDGRLTRQDVLTADHSRTVVYRTDAAGAAAAFIRYVVAGAHHIFIGPDHILFIVGLILLGGGARRTLGIVTAFTAAHSITLAVAALGAFRPPASIVEPLIAISIVTIGWDNLRTRRGGRDWRALIAFGFGLMHGFGFASVLGEVGLPREVLASSLLGFNLGVEAGQVCIVLLIAPALGLLDRKAPRVAARVVAAGSWGIVVAGGYWFLQRVGAGV